MPDGSGTMVINGVPQIWQEAVAEMAEALADRFRADQSERSREIGSLNQEVDSLRALIQQLTNRVSEADEARDELAGQVQALQRDLTAAGKARDELAGQVQALQRDLTAAGEAHTALARARDELAGQVENQTRQVDEALADVRGLAQQAIKGGETNSQALTTAGELTRCLVKDVAALQPLAGRVDELASDCQRLTTANQETSQALDDVRSLAQQAVKGGETNSASVAALTKRADQADALQADHAKATAATDAACSSLRDQVDELVRTGGELVQSVKETAETGAARVDEISGAVAMVEAVREQAGEMLRRVANVAASATAGFLIDQAGHLVAIRNNGEQVDLGQVVGQAGRDSAAPATLVAVAQEGDQVRFIMSDGVEHRAQIRLTQPAAPVTIAKDDPKWNGHSVADMVTMRANGLTFEKIGQLCGITGQYTARLIKKASKRDDGGNPRV